jgi:hypothetical protein
LILSGTSPAVLMVASTLPSLREYLSSDNLEQRPRLGILRLEMGVLWARLGAHHGRLGREVPL